jgi:ribose-phosphate pyrophosphokinase
MIKINNIQLDLFKFSAGEVHFELKKEPGTFDRIEVNFTSNDDLVGFMLLDQIYKTAGKRYFLHIPYMPYSRQDRATTKGSPNSFSVIMDIIENSNAHAVLTIDLHNPKVLKTGTKIESYIKIPDGFRNEDYVGLIVPDEGAKVRAHEFSSLTSIPILFQGSKVRNPSTGALSGYSLTVVGEYKEGDLLVFDDICDGGGTFILLAQEFKKNHSNELHLLVSHGIYSKGKDDLSKYYKTINCVYNLKEMK